jgi:two-component system sensor histidine kinase RegB
VLADFSRNPSAEGGDPYRIVPFLALVEEAAGPHRLVGIGLNVAANPGQPPVLLVSRRPELVHGLGNIVQNAFQFAKTGVDILLDWTGEKVLITVTDDGPGFPSGLLQKVGEPYISTRAGLGGGHMGLGVFIAKTLLERTKGRVIFGNRPGGGARVIVEWPRQAPIFVMHGGGTT